MTSWQNGVSEFTKSGREGDSRFEAVGIGKSIKYPVTDFQFEYGFSTRLCLLGQTWHMIPIPFAKLSSGIGWREKPRFPLDFPLKSLNLFIRIHNLTTLDISNPYFLAGWTPVLAPSNTETTMFPPAPAGSAVLRWPFRRTIRTRGGPNSHGDFPWRTVSHNQMLSYGKWWKWSPSGKLTVWPWKSAILRVN